MYFLSEIIFEAHYSTYFNPSSIFYAVKYFHFALFYENNDFNCTFRKKQSNIIIVLLFTNYNPLPFLSFLLGYNCVPFFLDQICQE